jgi:hypothetical protein
MPAFTSGSHLAFPSVSAATIRGSPSDFAITAQPDFVDQGGWSMSLVIASWNSLAPFGEAIGRSCMG